MGANLLKFIPKEKRPIFKKDTIIINLERFGHQEIFDQDYLDILKSFEVWDFSSLNMKRINLQYNLKIKKFLPIGYVKELEKIKKKKMKEKILTFCLLVLLVIAELKFYRKCRN